MSEYADTEPAPPPTPEQNRLCAARVWLAAESRSPHVYTSIMATRVLRALQQGAALGEDAAEWLTQRTNTGDAVHKGWAKAIKEAIYGA